MAIYFDMSFAGFAAEAGAAFVKKMRARAKTVNAVRMAPPENRVSAVQ
jgi:hypothetical protein